LCHDSPSVPLLNPRTLRTIASEDLLSIGGGVFPFLFETYFLRRGRCSRSLLRTAERYLRVHPNFPTHLSLLPVVFLDPYSPEALFRPAFLPNVPQSTLPPPLISVVSSLFPIFMTISKVDQLVRCRFRSLGFFGFLFKSIGRQSPCLHTMPLYLPHDRSCPVANPRKLFPRRFRPRHNKKQTSS